jgi:hypothetical protein
MSARQRCDEILRLIDDVLSEVAPRNEDGSEPSVRWDDQRA